MPKSQQAQTNWIPTVTAPLYTELSPSTTASRKERIWERTIWCRHSMSPPLHYQCYAKLIRHRSPTQQNDSSLYPDLNHQWLYTTMRMKSEKILHALKNPVLSTIHWQVLKSPYKAWTAIKISMSPQQAFTRVFWKKSLS